MNSKKSFFNGAIIHSDLRRFWWISALYSLGVFLFSIFPLLNHYAPNSEYLEKYGVLDPNAWFHDFSNGYLSRSGSGGLLLTGIIPIALAVLLFAYLHNQKATSTFHALPLSRTTLFFSHVSSGLILMTISTAVNVLILLLFRATRFGELIPLQHVLAWALLFLLYQTTFFLFSAAVGMFTGNQVAHLIFTYILGALPGFLYAMVLLILTSQLYGFVAPFSDWILDYIYIGPDRLIGSWCFLIYIGFSVIFALVALLAYRKRPLERCGDLVVFSVTRPIFLYGFALCSGALGLLYLCNWYNGKELSLLFMLPFAIVGMVIASMLLQKTLRPKHIIKPILIYTVCIAALFAFFHFDLSGFERRVPSIDEVESVTVDPRRNYARFDLSRQSPTWTEEEALRAFIAMHQAKIDDRTVSDNNYYTMDFVYNLKNGKMIERQYSLDYQKDAAYLKPIFETKEMRARYFMILRDDADIQYTTVSILDDRCQNGLFQTYYPNDATMDRLLAALAQDVSNVSYEDYVLGGDAPILTTIQVCHARYFENADGERALRDYANSEEYAVRSSYTNTIALLQELGLEQAFLDPQSLSHASINDDRSGEPIEISDPAELAQLFDFCTANGGTYMNIADLEDEKYVRLTVTFNGTVTIPLPSEALSRDDVPPILKQYANTKA